MIRKSLYNCWIVSLLGLTSFLLGGAVHGQVLDLNSLDSLPMYTLEEAMAVSDPKTVYKLSLKRKKMYHLPPEILRFEHLQILDVSKNKLEEFPMQALDFRYLQILDVGNNKISKIPKEIEQLIHLKELKAGDNVITTLPRTIKGLKGLRKMDLWGNEIEYLPNEIGELRDNLLDLDLRVIMMSTKEHKRLKELLPNTKIHFSRSCNCGF